MTSYESMKSKLEPLGLYRIESGSVIDSELKAYAEGLNVLFDKLDELEREGFAATSESYGLSEREKFIDREKASLSVEKRRELLIGAEKCGSTDATAEGFRQFLSDCGIAAFSIKELPKRQVLQIYIDDRLTDGEKSLLTKKIEQAAPVHLTVSIHFKDYSV